MNKPANLKRLILEMGMGNDLHGQDYTKAAVRAVNDALRHSMLTVFRHVGANPDDMQVDVTIGVQQPGTIDTAKVAEQLPYGTVSVKCVHGGLDITDPEDGTVSVIASAGIEAYLDLPEDKFKLASAVSD